MPLYANAYYLMANTVVNSLSGFVFWALAARLYLADDVGVASTVISAVLLLSGLSSLGLGSGLIRFLPQAGTTRDEMLDSSLTLVSLVSILAAFIFLIGLPLWSPALTTMYSQPVFVASFVLFTSLFTWSGVINHVFIARRAAKFTFFTSAITSVKVFLIVILAGLHEALGIFISMSTAVAISLGAALFWFLPVVQRGYFPRPRLRLQILGSMIPFSITRYLASFLSQTPQIILPIMALNVLGAKESAYLYTAWMFASMLFMIPGAISISIFAEGSNAEDALADNVRKSLSLTARLVVPATLLTLILGEKMLLFFGGDYAKGGSTLLTILALSTPLISINNIYFAVKSVAKETTTILILSLVGVGCTLGLSRFLMPIYGIAGAGVGWLVSRGVITGFIVCSTLLKGTLKSWATKSEPTHPR